MSQPIEYKPSYGAACGRGLHADSYVARVRTALAAETTLYGAYPFANEELAADTGLPLKQLTPVLSYLAARREWVPHRGPIMLLADPAATGRRLRRGTVLVRPSTSSPESPGLR